MSGSLAVGNRHGRWRVDARRLRPMVACLMGEGLGLREWELGVCLVGERVMATMNQRWLAHEGSTDILTFDLRDAALGVDAGWRGELVICLDDAERQAREFGETLDSEVARYVVHGILHLAGHEDHEAAARRRMKREEDRWVGQWRARFGFQGLVVRRGRGTRA